MNDTGASIVFYGLVLLLPLSALIARRLPLGHVAKLAAAWVAIFAIGFVLVSQRDRVLPAWHAVSDTVFGRDQTVSGDAVRIRMGEDGHFWADVEINGVARRMLIDSGATTTALSAETAKAAGIDVDESPFPILINTANGEISARVATARTFRLGAIAGKDLPVVVSDAFGDTDVVGMNFLSRLKAWRVEGPFLILEPRPSI